MTEDDAESAAAPSRSTDIEDQGQDVDAAGDVDADVESVEGAAADPGPEGEGAAEATQRTGDDPTEVVDRDPDSDDG